MPLSPGTLGPQGWGGVTQEEIPQGSAGGREDLQKGSRNHRVGITSFGVRQRFIDPILVGEKLSPTPSEAHHLSVSLFIFF